MLRKLFIFNFVIFLAFNPFTKLHSIEPDVFVQSTVNRAAETLGGNLSTEERIEELKKIATDTVDIPGIGFYSLGKFRKTMTNEKKMSIKKFSENIF